MKLLTVLFMGFLLFTGLSFAATTDDDLVTVQKKFVSADGLSKAKDAASASTVSNWAGVGKEIGEATRDALNSVVDVSDKFSKTDVGKFVLVMVAYKVIGQKIIAVVLGIPVFLFGIGVWIFVFRRFFCSYRVLIENDTTVKVKKYNTVNYEFYTSEGRAGAGIALFVAIAGWSIVWIVLIFG